MENVNVTPAASAALRNLKRVALIGLLGLAMPMTAHAADWVATGDDIYYIAGKVGIGTIAPAFQFDLRGGDMAIDNGQSIYFRASGGTTSVGSRIHRASGGALRIAWSTAMIFDSYDNTPFRIANQAGTTIFRIDPLSTSSIAGFVNLSGAFGIGTATPDTDSRLDVNGLTKTVTLEITGGSDLSELFDIEGVVQPGMLVSIDPANPGNLKPTAAAYDRKVVGIVSGAGDVRPGMVMSQAGTLADGKFPVALTGRVYVMADASQGPIEAGDLLTSAALPGHAMRVGDGAAGQGAIIGKAMTSLEQGQGLVMVLVSLQ